MPLLTTIPRIIVREHCADLFFVATDSGMIDCSPGRQRSAESGVIFRPTPTNRASPESSPHAEKRPKLIDGTPTSVLGSPDSHHPHHTPGFHHQHHHHAQFTPQHPSHHHHHHPDSHATPHSESQKQLLNENLKLLNDSFPDTVPPLARLQLQQLYLQIAEAVQDGPAEVKDVLEAVVRFGVMAMGASVAAQE